MTQSKEAFRQFLHSTINPLAQQIASEMSVKLELTLNMDKLMESDIFTRAKSYKLLRESGIPELIAARICGIWDSDLKMDK